MSDETTKTAVPKLRFPEFREAGEWVEKQIKALFDLENKPEKGGVFDNAKIITVRLHGLGVVKNDRAATLTGATNYFKRETGQFIFSKIDLLNGAFGLIPEELNGFVSSSDVPALSFKNQESAGFFLNWILANYKNLALERTGTSSTLKRVSKGGFADAAILLPSLPEQQKIAAVLSSLDDLLTAQNAKLAALQAHKRGLMQGLFPAEGETVPKLRFPEFREAGEWVEKKIGSIMTEGRLGSNFQSSEADYGTPIIKMVNINRGRINLDKVEYLTENGTYNESDLLKTGDLLFNTRNTLELVGKVAIWNNELPMAVYNTNLLRIVFDDKAVSSNYFMNYLFNTQDILEKLRSIATGTTSVAAIYGKDLNQLVVNIPSPAEQQKIADCLSSLDNRISAQSQKIEALKLHKKGLMQGLFPAAATDVGS